MFQGACPDANVIMWVIETCLGNGAAGDHDNVDYVIRQVALEAIASGSALSDRFLMRLQGILSQEIVVTLSDRFANRLHDLCAEEQHIVSGAGRHNWKLIGF